MRRSLAATLVVAAAGLIASAAARRITARRRAVAIQPPAAGLVVPAVGKPGPQVPAGPDAVVLPFERRGVVEAAAPRPAAPARCGDNGGRTRSGAACAARATSGGRCHHHPLAA